MDLGWQELLIVLLIALLVFGGSKLAGLGRASGKAIREFKEETQGLNEKKAQEAAAQQANANQIQAPVQPPVVQQPQQTAQPQQPQVVQQPQQPQVVQQPVQPQQPGQSVNGETVNPPQNN